MNATTARRLALRTVTVAGGVGGGALLLSAPAHAADAPKPKPSGQVLSRAIWLDLAGDAAAARVPDLVGLANESGATLDRLLPRALPNLAVDDGAVAVRIGQGGGGGGGAIKVTAPPSTTAAVRVVVFRQND